MKHVILEKARSHKYIRRTGAPKQYHYIYSMQPGKNEGEKPLDVKRIKRINSHTGLARFLAGVSDLREIPRQKDIPSPYAYSPTHVTYNWNGKEVFVVETAHKQYDIFQVIPNKTLEMKPGEIPTIEDFKNLKEVKELPVKPPKKQTKVDESKLYREYIKMPLYRRAHYGNSFEKFVEAVKQHTAILEEKPKAKQAMEPGVTEENRGGLFKVKYKLGSGKIKAMTLRAISKEHAKELFTAHKPEAQIAEIKENVEVAPRKQAMEPSYPSIQFPKKFSNSGAITKFILKIAKTNAGDSQLGSAVERALSRFPLSSTKIIYDDDVKGLSQEVKKVILDAAIKSDEEKAAQSVRWQTEMGMSQKEAEKIYPFGRAKKSIVKSGITYNDGVEREVVISHQRVNYPFEYEYLKVSGEPIDKALESKDITNIWNRMPELLGQITRLGKMLDEVSEQYEMER